jgi:hypothetical protein
MKHLLIPFLFLLFSCGNEPKTKPANEVVTVKDEQPGLPIKEFIKKFKIIQTPFRYFGGNAGQNYESQLFELKKNSIDTLFHPVPSDAAAYGFGMLADTSNFYSLIYFHSADALYPVLYTYSKSGKLIGEESLIVRGCGSDCGMSYCSSTAYINKDLSIYMADTLHYEENCDDADNVIPVDSTFIFSKTGSIDKSGKIKMSEEKEQRTATKK